MQLNVEVQEQWLENWPEMFYRIAPRERAAALAEQLRRYPDSVDDQRREVILKKRYNRDFDDVFMLAWMMLKVADAQNTNLFTRTRYRYDVETELRRLCILDETEDEILRAEWRQFGDFLIHTYVKSPSFRSAIFGMGSVSDRNTALRLAGEIETVTKTVPGRIGHIETVRPFREIILERYTALIPSGAELLREAQAEIR